MKRKLLLSFIVFAALSCCAQKIDASKVPAAARHSFETKYPGIIPKWEKEKENYEVNFNQNGHSMSAVIASNGTIIETETDIKIAELPAAILSYVQEHYQGKTIKEAAKITKADGTVSYEAEVSGMDLMFDANGEFVRQAKD